MAAPLLDVKEVETKLQAVREQFISSSSRSEEINTLKSYYAKLRVKSECKHEEVARTLKELQENRDLCRTSEEYKSIIQILENEKRDLSIIANKRNKDIERLNEEIAQLNKSVSAANNDKREAQAKLSELQSQEVSRELARMQAVMDSLKETTQEQNKRRESRNQKLKEINQEIEFEIRIQHKNQVEGLEREIANLKRRLEASSEEKNKQATTWKIPKLELEIEPLQKSLRELESQKDTLTVERNVLKEEVNCWKNRTYGILEQCAKTDPEEHKQLIQERDSLRKGVEDKSKESSEKTATINSLKQIGRKYKKMAEDVTKELEELKVKAAGQKTDKEAVSGQQTDDDIIVLSDEDDQEAVRGLQTDDDIIVLIDEDDQEAVSGPQTDDDIIVLIDVGDQEAVRGPQTDDDIIVLIDVDDQVQQECPRKLPVARLMCKTEQL